MKDDVLARLADLDAAAHVEPSAVELDRQELLLQSVLSDTARPRHPAVAALGRPLTRRVAFTLAGALAAGAVLAAVTGGPSGEGGRGGSGPLSSSEVATWTGTAKGLSNAHGTGQNPLVWCIRATKEASGEGGPGEVTNADIRGTIASMIVTRHGHASYCLTGADGSGVTTAVDPLSKSPDSADGIRLGTVGTRGSGSARFSYAVGTMGSGVKEITLHEHGRTVHATLHQIPSLQYGRWTAWWPDDAEPGGPPTGTVTVTLTDGTSRTVDGAALAR